MIYRLFISMRKVFKNIIYSFKNYIIYTQILLHLEHKVNSDSEKIENSLTSVRFSVMISNRLLISQ